MAGMATLLVCRVGGEAVLGPLCFESPLPVVNLREKLHESVSVDQSQEMVLLQNGNVLLDAAKLEGGSLEDPQTITLVITAKTYRAVVWGPCADGPQYAEVGLCSVLFGA